MLVFALIMLLTFAISGVALVGALMISRRTRLDLERRVALANEAVIQRVAQAEFLRRAEGPDFETWLRRAFTIGHGQTWAMRSGVARLLLMAGAIAALTLLVTYAGVGWSLWLVTPLALAAAFMLPRIILLREQKKAELEFNELFPDAVVSIARMLRAGLPITSAVRAVSKEAAAPVSTVFATISDQIEIGTPVEEALEKSSREVGLPDFRFFTVAIVLQHLTGGNLAATLEILADIIRRRRAVRMKARATTAEIRVSAYVLGSLPFLIVGALLIIQPGYLSPLITDPRGHIILMLAAGGLLAAGLTMRQMMHSVTTL